MKPPRKHATFSISSRRRSERKIRGGKSLSRPSSPTSSNCQVKASNLENESITVHPRQQRGRHGEGTNEKQSREEEAESGQKQEEGRSGSLSVFAATARRKRRRQEILAVWTARGHAKTNVTNGVQ